MALAFACPTCGYVYNVEREQAGKLARCKICKTVTRLPSRKASKASRSTEPTEPVPADRFGFDDQPNAYSIPAEPPADEEDYPSLAPRATHPVTSTMPARASKRRGSRRRSDDEPWGVPLRDWAIGLYAVVFLVMVVNTLMFGPHVPLPPTLNFLTGLVMLASLGSFWTSVIGALVSWISGNRSAFAPGESMLIHYLWIMSIVLNFLGILLIGFVLMVAPFPRGMFQWRSQGQSNAPVVSSVVFPPNASHHERMILTLLNGMKRHTEAVGMVKTWASAATVEQALRSSRSIMQTTRASARILGPPAPPEVARLQGLYADTYRTAIEAHLAAIRAALIRSASDGELTAALNKNLDQTTSYLTDYDSQADWYQAVIGDEASRPLAYTPPATGIAPGQTPQIRPQPSFGPAQLQGPGMAPPSQNNSRSNRQRFTPRLPPNRPNFGPDGFNRPGFNPAPPPN